MIIQGNELRLDQHDINIYLKNRKPLLFVDDVVVEPGVCARMIRNMSDSEWFFECHFPGNPLMPGVLQLEMMCQTAALSLKTLEGYKDKTTNLARVDGIRYLEPIRPGDCILVQADIKRFSRGVALVNASIVKQEKTCCEARFTLVVLDDIKKYGAGIENEA